MGIEQIERVRKYPQTHSGAPVLTIGNSCEFIHWNRTRDIRQRSKGYPTAPQVVQGQMRVKVKGHFNYVVTRNGQTLFEHVLDSSESKLETAGCAFYLPPSG